jgi:hypothetical protein
MNSTKAKIALLNVAAIAVMVVPTAFANDVLKGKVQKADQPVRIARPSMPLLGVAEIAEVGDPQSKAVAPKKAQLTANDFTLDFKKQAPTTAPDFGNGQSKPSPKLTADTEDADLIIEWEEWHHRISKEIFEHWRVLGIFPGTAMATMRFSRDRRVQVHVDSVELDESIYEILSPRYRMYTLPQLQREFARVIEESVMPLDGSSVVTFPERSKRTLMTFTSSFSNDGTEGYRWNHGDTERIRVK